MIRIPANVVWDWVDDCAGISQELPQTGEVGSTLHCPRMGETKQLQQTPMVQESDWKTGQTFVETATIYSNKMPVQHSCNCVACHTGIQYNQSEC